MFWKFKEANMVLIISKIGHRRVMSTNMILATSQIGHRRVVSTNMVLTSSQIGHRRVVSKIYTYHPMPYSLRESNITFLCYSRTD